MLEKQMGQEEWSRMSEKDRQKKVRLFKYHHLFLRCNNVNVLISGRPGWFSFEHNKAMGFLTNKNLLSLLFN